MPLNDLSTNTTQPAGPGPAGQLPAPQPGLNWQRPVFTAPGPRTAPPNANAGRIPGIVMSRRPRWTPEKHARILARIKASRTDLMPPLPEVVEEALDTARPATVDSSWTAAIGQLAETTKSCFYGLTEGALDLLQRSMPAGGSGSWPLPGAGATTGQASDQGSTMQCRADSTDPACAVQPTDTPRKPPGNDDFNRLKSFAGKDFDIAVGTLLSGTADMSLDNVLIVIGDPDHYHSGMGQLIDALLRNAVGPDDLMFAESPSDVGAGGIECHGISPERCIGIDNPEVRNELKAFEKGYFDAARAVINLVRRDLPEAQQDTLAPLLGPQASYMDASRRLNDIVQLLTKGRLNIPPKRAPDLKRQLDEAMRQHEGLVKLVKDPKRYKARDDHMVKQLRSAIDSGRLQGRKGFVVIGQGHLSNIKQTLLKQFPCIVLEQRKFKDLPPQTWLPGQRITY